MNKHEIDRLLPMAYEIIDQGQWKNEKGKTEKFRIAEGKNKGKINKAYRGQISSYGAAIANGSLLAATAFFSKNDDKSKVNRVLLMNAINDLLYKANMLNGPKADTLFETIRSNFGTTTGQHNDITEKVLICATALKLAFNLFDLVDEDKTKDEKPDESGGQEAVNA